jgi:hypothetical protein
MKQAYLVRLKTAEDACFGLNPDEALDQWMEEHFPGSRPSYLDIACRAPSGLRMLCVWRGFAELERAHHGY